MLGESSSGDGGGAVAGGGGGGSTSGDEEKRTEEDEGSFGGNRWPRQEALALLEAFNHLHHPSTTPFPNPPSEVPTVANNHLHHPHVSVPSTIDAMKNTTVLPMTILQGTSTSINPINNLFCNSSNSSLSTSSDDMKEGRCNRKRKLEDLFDRLMKEVVKKQEEQQRTFLEAIEKREHERMAREESWRVQEMQRINKEKEIIAQERSIAAAKDAAVMTFLQKITAQQNVPQALNNNIVIPNIAPSEQEQVMRWPKVEIETLIKLRSELDVKYQENTPKGPLWEEISYSMKKLGYSRNAKRCREKWENINKYFKKVKESTKNRPQDSKTCPYFHQLDALYKEKNKMVQAESMVAPPLMVQPEHQWPPEQQSEEEEKDDGEEEEDEENENGDSDKYITREKNRKI